ncbi:acetate--CoA ligase family protein [Streptomyces sp. NPDC096311]|uniref:acetate--CoA ligase family protein n=1 Tax=Streptomyces sp. NPDC096311 TaxID=3366083 RepID=UPI00382B672F
MAVLGASRHAGKLGAAMARQLASFTGELSLINPRLSGSDPAFYPSIEAAASSKGSAPELVIACLPASATVGALAEAARTGCRAAVVCSGGFVEVGGSGIQLQEQLARISGDTGMRILGPNTSGFIAPGRSLTASFVRGAEEILPGTVGLVAASGGVNHALAFALSSAGVGVELAVGLGNAADVTAADVVDHLADSPTVRCIALHVETIPDGPALLAAVSRAALRVPVVALVVGQADVGDFARSHTGALATSWRTTRAALSQAGAVLVDDERQLIDAVSALSLTRLPAEAGTGVRVGLVTAQAGPGLLIADGLRSSGIDIPTLGEGTTSALSNLLPPLTYQLNPVDTGRPGETFTEVVNAVGADPSVDLVTVYGLLEPDAVDLAKCLVDSDHDAVPVVAVVGGLADQIDETRRRLHAEGIPVLDSPASAVAAVRALRDDARALGRLRRAKDDAPALTPLVITERLNEQQLKSVLEEAGVTVPDSQVCVNRAEANAALRKIGAPVVVKVLEPVLDHKTDAGGVHLNVRTESEMEQAVASLERIGASSHLVEAMVPSSAELLVGAHRDPVFGPTLVIGSGGVTAELLADVALRRPPVGPDAVAGMIDELALAQLVQGYRGAPQVDIAGLTRICTVLCRILAGSPDVTSIEINPVLVGQDGSVVAVDAALSIVVG